MSAKTVFLTLIVLTCALFAEQSEGQASGKIEMIYLHSSGETFMFEIKGNVAEGGNNAESQIRYRVKMSDLGSESKFDRLYALLLSAASNGSKIWCNAEETGEFDGNTAQSVIMKTTSASLYVY